ncbi:MAG TPA: hypothetical protein PKJ33_03525 [Alphaproteobacteria bacterium]|nr:hypothetical protein [Alphaproteobacteria bacterium]
MKKFILIFTGLTILFGCKTTNLTKSENSTKLYGKEPILQFSLNTRKNIDNIPKGYGVKGLQRIKIDNKIIETKGSLALLRDKDIKDSKHYIGGTILPNELEIIPPNMIRPLDGSEGDPLYLNIINKQEIVKFNTDLKNGPSPKFITNCITSGDITTCTTY